jgi:hypothetical protein
MATLSNIVLKSRPEVNERSNNSRISGRLFGPMDNPFIQALEINTRMIWPIWDISVLTRGLLVSSSFIHMGALPVLLQFRHAEQRNTKQPSMFERH